MSKVRQTLLAEPATVSSERRHWLGPVLLVVVVLTVYASTIAHTFVSLDLWSADFGTWHLARTGSPWVDGLSMPPLHDVPLRSTWVANVDGHEVIARSPGVIAASLPAYALARPESFTTVPSGLSAALMTAVAVLLVFLTLRARMRVRDAWLATLTFAFATPVWSVAANGMWPHTVTVLGIAGMAWAASSERWWLVGLFGGITLWGRLHAAVIVAILGLLVGLRRRSPGLVLRVGLASGAFLAAMAVWTHWMYHSWNPTSQYDTAPLVAYARQQPFDITNQLGMWISPGHGFLVWTPVVILLTPALVRSWRGLPDWSQGLAVGGVAYTILQAALESYTGGDFNYGYRLALELLTCLTPALALSARRMGPWARRLLGPTLALQVLAILPGAIQDGGFVGRDTAWTRNAFVLVVDKVGLLGWITVAVAVGLGALAGRAWGRAA